MGSRIEICLKRLKGVAAITPEIGLHVNTESCGPRLRAALERKTIIKSRACLTAGDALTKKGKGKVNTSRKPPKVPAIDFGDLDEADRLFREAIKGLEALPPEVISDSFSDKDTGKKGPTAKAKSHAKRRQKTAREVDLHGLTLDAAISRLEVEIQALLQDLSSPVTLKIITGKGLHSGAGGAVLPREVHRYVKRTFGGVILQIEDSPADLAIGGIPLRGHFSVTFGKKSGTSAWGR